MPSTSSQSIETSVEFPTIFAKESENEFTIHPVVNTVKQIEIKVQSIQYPSIEHKLILQTSYSPSNDYMTVKPLINKNYCNKSLVEFKVLFKREVPQQVFYQVRLI